MEWVDWPVDHVPGERARGSKEGRAVERAEGHYSGRDHAGGIEVALEGYQISRSSLTGQWQGRHPLRRSYKSSAKRL